MSPTPCFAPEDVAAVLAAPDDDPRRAHARDCPKCGALLAAYRLYEAMPAPADAAEVAAAEARLQAFIAREIGGSDTAREPRPTPRLADRRPRVRWFQPALAFAAIAIVAVAMLWPRSTVGPPHVTLRGAPATAPPVALRGPRVAAGRFTAHWAAVAGAEKYEVRFYGTDLAHLGALASTDTLVDVDASSLPFTLDPARKVLVRVVAMEAGREIAASAPQELEER